MRKALNKACSGLEATKSREGKEPQGFKPLTQTVSKPLEGRKASKMKITEKQRDNLKYWLEEHQKVKDALYNLGKPSFKSTLSVDDDDNSDYTVVSLDTDIAKTALTEQKIRINTELNKFKIVL